MCNFAIGKSSAKTIVAKNTKNSFIMNFLGPVLSVNFSTFL